MVSTGRRCRSFSSNGPATPNEAWRTKVIAVIVGISTLSLLPSLIAPRSAGSLIIGVVVWLVGLAVIILLFSKESRPFFSKQAPR